MTMPLVSLLAFIFPLPAFCAPGFMDAQSFLLQIFLGICVLFYLLGGLALLRWRRQPRRPANKAISFNRLFFGFFLLIFLFATCAFFYVRGSMLFVFLGGILFNVVSLSLLMLLLFAFFRWIMGALSSRPRWQARFANFLLVLWIMIPIYLGARIAWQLKADADTKARLHALIDADKASCEKGEAEKCVRVFEHHRELSPFDYGAYERGRPFLALACEKGLAKPCSDYVFRMGLSDAEAAKYFAMGCKLKDEEACVRLADQGDRARARKEYQRRCKAGVRLACERLKDEVTGE